jgi:peptidoglycan/LPS O-acetylase OafA/YrhL
VFAALAAVTIWAAIQQAHGGPLPAPPAYPGFPAFPLTHLWFLYVLLWFYAAALALRALARAVDRQGRLGALADRLVGWAMGTPLVFLMLAAPAAITLYLTPGWMMWFGTPTPDSSLVPNVAASAAYFTAFGFGWLLQRRTDLLPTLRARWPLTLAVAILASAAGLAITGPAPLLTPSATGLAKAAFAVTYACASWAWTFALIGLALRFFDGHSPARRYLADSSYWLYIVHLPLIVALQTIVAPYAWPWPVKFAIILGVAFPVMLASYELLVRHTFIGAMLNGRRIPWRRPKPAALPVAADSRHAGA